MEKGKSSTLGSARCRFKRLRRVESLENKVEIKTKETTASDAWMSMLERCFRNPGFWKCGQLRPTLFGRCFTRGLQRLQVHPESHFQCGRYCYALPYACVPECTYVISGGHNSHLIMCTVGSICIIFEFTNKTSLYQKNSRIPRGRPSLSYDHTNAILRVVV